VVIVDATAGNRKTLYATRNSGDPDQLCYSALHYRRRFRSITCPLYLFPKYLIQTSVEPDHFIFFCSRNSPTLHNLTYVRRLSNTCFCYAKMPIPIRNEAIPMPFMQGIDMQDFLFHVRQFLATDCNYFRRLNRPARTVRKHFLDRKPDYDRRHAISRTIKLMRISRYLPS
jgi:hypothetical protein